MKSIFLFLIIIFCFAEKTSAQTSVSSTNFKTGNELEKVLCKNWVCVADSESFQFLGDSTFWFTVGDEKFFGRWDFDTKSQTLIIDYSEDHIFDQNFHIIKLDECEFVCSIRSRIGGPTAKEVMIPCSGK